ncbi:MULTISPECIES: hypothetical protein [unclassified Pseudomonas]|nr:MULTISPECIES: hypothetical protein [unclassified Pseudomonas]
MIIPDIMIDPIIRAMTYTMGPADVVIRFVIGAVISPITATFTAT